MSSLTEAIVETITQPLLVLDGELRVKAANRAFLQHFGVEPAETLGCLVYDLGNGQWRRVVSLAVRFLANRAGRPVTEEMFTSAAKAIAGR